MQKVLFTICTMLILVNAALAKKELEIPYYDSTAKDGTNSLASMGVNLASSLCLVDKEGNTYIISGKRANGGYADWDGNMGCCMWKIDKNSRIAWFKDFNANYELLQLFDDDKEIKVAYNAERPIGEMKYYKDTAAKRKRPKDSMPCAGIYHFSKKTGELVSDQQLNNINRDGKPMHLKYTSASGDTCYYYFYFKPSMVARRFVDSIEKAYYQTYYNRIFFSKHNESSYPLDDNGLMPLVLFEKIMWDDHKQQFIGFTYRRANKQKIIIYDALLHATDSITLPHPESKDIYINHIISNELYYAVQYAYADVEPALINKVATSHMAIFDKQWHMISNDTSANYADLVFVGKDKMLGLLNKYTYQHADSSDEPVTICELDLHQHLLKQKHIGRKYTMASKILSVPGNELIVTGNVIPEITPPSVKYKPGKYSSFTNPRSIYYNRIGMNELK